MHLLRASELFTQGPWSRLEEKVPGSNEVLLGAGRLRRSGVKRPLIGHLFLLSLSLVATSQPNVPQWAEGEERKETSWTRWADHLLCTKTDGSFWFPRRGRRGIGKKKPAFYGLTSRDHKERLQKDWKCQTVKIFWWIIKWGTVVGLPPSGRVLGRTLRGIFQILNRLEAHCDQHLCFRTPVNKLSP